MIGRGYGVKTLAPWELAARREHHSAVLEYRRNRPEEIRERLELIANAEAIQWNREYLASLSLGSRWDPEYLQSLTASMRNQDNRPAMVPPPPSVAPPSINPPTDVYDGAELCALEFATAAECAASEPTDAEREELRTRDTAPETTGRTTMTTYTIENTTSGHVIGDYDGETREHAIAAMLRDAGYRADVVDGDVETDCPNWNGGNDLAATRCPMGNPCHYCDAEPGEPCAADCDGPAVKSPAADLGTRETAPDPGTPGEAKARAMEAAGFNVPDPVPAVKVGGRKRAARNANAPAAVVTTCPTCGKEFASDAARRGHMRVHKGAAE